MLVVPAVTTRAALQGLSALGHDADALARAAGLPPLVTGEEMPAPDAVVPQGAFGHLWALAAETDSRLELPVLAGLRVPPNAFGLLDYTFMSAATLGAALSALARFFRLASGASSLHPEPDTGWVYVRNDPVAEYDAVADAFTLASIVSRFRVRLPSLPVLHVDLALAPGADAAPFAEAFGAPVRLGRPVSGLRLDRAVWLAGLPGADAALHRTLAVVAAGTEVAAVLATPVGSGSVTGTVAGAVALTLTAGPPRVDAVARSLGVSARTLQRRLASEGATFQGVVDGVRRDEAARQLRRGGLSLGDIADRLGYAEQASFTRAFQRWHGTTPSRWRRSHSV